MKPFDENEIEGYTLEADWPVVIGVITVGLLAGVALLWEPDVERIGTWIWSLLQ
jgi:hypothetical protein